MKTTRIVGRPLIGLAATAAGCVLLAAASAVVAQSPMAVPPAALGNNLLAVSPDDFADPSKLLRRVAPDGGAPLAVRPNEHPLLPVLRWAKRDLPTIEALHDYSATLIKRERIRGRLGGYECLFVKIRHKPLSVYVRFQAPAAVEGQEVIYVAGCNQGNMLAHRPNMAVALSVQPEGMVAMTNRRYPLTEIGLVNLVRRLVEVGQQDLDHDECEVQYFAHAKLNKRLCTVIQVVHPEPREYFRFHLARIFVDEELGMPTRYESYDWPREPGGQPRLIEEFTYLDLKLNNGFTDEDFSTENPEYRFQ